MNWRTQFQQGSFRGVPFLLDAADGQIGRRTVVHEYPLRDLPYPEDMGRQARAFDLDCYVLGEDYFPARDRLIRALEAPGPGTLVHPYRGVMEVSVLPGSSVSERAREGGRASFRVAFIEAGQNAFPSARADTQAQVESAATAAQGSAQDEFAGRFSRSGLPLPFQGSSTAAFLAGLKHLERTVLDGGPRLVRVPDFRRELARMQGQSTALLADPARLAQALGELVGQASDLFAGQPDKLLGVQRRVAEFGPGLAALPRSTPRRGREGDNQQQLVSLVTRLALAEAARASARVIYASTLAASNQRDGLAQRLTDSAVGATVSNHAALLRLRRAVIDDINTRAVLLPLAIRSLIVTQPALLAAHDALGDATQADALVARNAIRHPGAVTGELPLEVLRGQ